MGSSPVVVTLPGRLQIYFFYRFFRYILFSSLVSFAFFVFFLVCLFACFFKWKTYVLIYIWLHWRTSDKNFFACLYSGNKTTFLWPKFSHLEIHLHSVYPPPPTPLSAGGGLEPPTKFSNSGGLDRSFTFRGGLLEKREVIFFRGVMVERVGGGGGGVQFSHKK